MTEDAAADSGTTYNVRNSDLLRVLVALAGRLAFPPEQLLQVVGRPYVAAYNMCTGELSLASIAKATGIDRSNLRKAGLRWEQAGVAFRVGPEGRLLRLYSLPTQGERTGANRPSDATSGNLPEPGDGDRDGQEKR
jgi:hypothetical protein